MSISKALSIQLLNISQDILSSIQTGRLTRAEAAVRRLAFVVTTQTEPRNEVARWSVEEDC